MVESPAIDWEKLAQKDFEYDRAPDTEKKGRHTLEKFKKKVTTVTVHPILYEFADLMGHGWKSRQFNEMLRDILMKNKEFVAEKMRLVEEAKDALRD